MPVSRIVVAWCMLAVVAAVMNSAAAERLNVLFIAVDDMRVELGAAGRSPAQTPHLDALARRGMRFRRAYCQQALCNPSRASLLTGRRPDTLRIWDLPTHFRERDPSLITLPQHFKQHGYFTQNIGKVFHNWRQNIQGDPQSWSVAAEMHYATHDSDQPQVEGVVPASSADAPRCENRDVPDEAYFDGRIARRAVDALGQLQDRPFFLAVGFWKPHLPFNPPRRYWELYDRSKLMLPQHPQPPIGVPPLALHDGRELLRAAPGRELTDAQVLELRHGYYAGISYLDAQVGLLLAELERLELTERTVVVFWSDHGFHLGEHGLWCKTSNYELDARVPLIIAAPEMSPAVRGTSTDALVELLDLYPTLSDVCELPLPAGLEGTSLKPLLQGTATAVKPAAYTQHPRPAYFQGSPEFMGCSVRTDRYRYTEWRHFATGDVAARELYDHQTDPAETTNVIAAPPDRDAWEVAERLLVERFPRTGYPSP